MRAATDLSLGWVRRLLPGVLLLGLAFSAGPLPDPPHGSGWLRAAGAEPASAAACLACEGQALAYQLYWCPDSHGAYCWALFRQYCPTDAEALAAEIVSAALDLAQKQLPDATQWVEALACAAVARTCLTDVARACHAECAYDPRAYLPNLRVACGEGMHEPGLVYDPTAGTLVVRVRNAGYALARNVTWSLSVGSTSDAARHVTGTIVASGTIPALAPACTARQGPGVPPKEFVTQVAWSAPAGRYAEALLTVDGNQDVAETNELDNVCRLRLDDLPAPCRLDVREPYVERDPADLRRVSLEARIVNTGSTACAASRWELRAGSAEGPLAGGGGLDLAPGVGVTVRAAVVLEPGGDPDGRARAVYLLRALGPGDALHDEHLFEVPRLAGRISGRVTDADDRPVEGALVEASGVRTRTQGYGFYHLDGVPAPGLVTVSASHERYSASASRLVPLVYRPQDPASGLERQGVDLVLGQVPGTLTLVFRDAVTRERLGGVTWTAVLPPTRLAGTLAAGVSQHALSVAPGEWLVTGSRAGYATATERTVVATGATSTLVLYLEPFAPLEDDGRLRLERPHTLWTRTVEGWVYAHASSKDGRLLVLYTADPAAPGSGRLRFLDAQSGVEQRAVPVPSVQGQQQAWLDVAYRQDPVAFHVNLGPFGRAGPAPLVLYDAAGNERARLDAPPRVRPYVEVSPDGAWVYAWGLFDTRLGEVPDHRALDPRQYPQGFPQETYPLNEALHFTRAGHVIGQCPEGVSGRVCRHTLDERVLATLAEARPPLRQIDSGGPSGTAGGAGGAPEVLLVGTDTAVGRYEGAALTWQRVPADFGLPHALDLEDLALSPGGQVVLLVQGRGNGRLHVYSFGPRPPWEREDSSDPHEITPRGVEPWVRHVAADEQGLCYLLVKGHELTYVRLGRYERPPPK